ncbi:MAG TPA: BON domain-containing protein [Bacteriovoracaceae bacterium]|nr:BON domain-containing protein [Bacteriovoracaceae bacterium]
MRPEDEEIPGESEYSVRQTIPLEMNEEYISLALNDFTHELSDEEIRFKAAYLLRVHQDVDSEEINLTCNDGVVTLKGLVDNKDMKDFCTRLCSIVPGVKKVINNLVF